MFALQSQQGQQMTLIKGLIQPDLRVLGFTKPLSPNLMQQINSISFDLNEPTGVNKTINYSYNQIYEKLKQNPTQQELATFLATITNREEVFKKHPYGLLILTSPIGLDWLENVDNGKKLIAFAVSNMLFTNILTERFGNNQAQMTISRLNLDNEALLKKTAQDKGSQEQAVQYQLQQQAIGLGMQQLQKQAPIVIS